MNLTAARITGSTGRPRWRSSILSDSTRSDFFNGVPDHSISPARRPKRLCNLWKTRKERQREAEDLSNQVSTKPREAQGDNCAGNVSGD